MIHLDTILAMPIITLFSHLAAPGLRTEDEPISNNYPAQQQPIFSLYRKTFHSGSQYTIRSYYTGLVTRNNHKNRETVNIYKIPTERLLYIVILSQTQLNHNSTQPNIIKVGFDTKMTLNHHPPTTHHHW